MKDWYEEKTETIERRHFRQIMAVVNYPEVRAKMSAERRAAIAVELADCIDLPDEEKGKLFDEVCPEEEREADWAVWALELEKGAKMKNKIKAIDYVRSLAGVHFRKCWASVKRQTGYTSKTIIDEGGDRATDIYHMVDYARRELEERIKQNPAC